MRVDVCVSMCVRVHVCHVRMSVSVCMYCMCVCVSVHMCVCVCYLADSVEFHEASVKILKSSKRSVSLGILH